MTHELRWELIWDGFKYLLTPFPLHLKKMGYARELKNLRIRRQRCHTAWQPHLERTKSLILEAAECCTQRNTVLIIGSGLLFDIPLTELSKRFREVILVDILHLRQVHRIIDSYSNVRLHRLDITGIVKEVHAITSSGMPLKVPDFKPQFFLSDRVDLVASVNIVSQLPVLPNGYVYKKLRSSNSEWVKKFSRQLVINHLDWLASFTGNVCLISDLERLYCDGDTVLKREKSLWGVELPTGRQEWEWNLAPRPEIEWKQDIRHRVVGYPEFPKTKWHSSRDTLDGQSPTEKM